MIFKTQYDSPVGQLTLLAHQDSLMAVLWPDERKNRVPLLMEQAQNGDRDGFLSEVKMQLDAYFAKKLWVFDVPLAPQGTDFQKTVWFALQNIPYGQTRTYFEQAQSINNPKAIRAVGAANGRNPISIILPCHRVVGGDGSLTGFAGGLKAKAFLLAHEGVLQQTSTQGRLF